MDIEKTYVEETYKKIAPWFHNSRAYVWPGVKEFINNLSPNSYILDAGCGNGKNMFRKDISFIGIDMCPQLLSYTKEDKKILGNLLYLPFRPNIFDAIICIAVLNHISEKVNLINILKTFSRILTKDGKLLIELWNTNAFNPKRFHHLKENDYLVEWNNADRTQVYHRYYRLYDKPQILEILSEITELKLITFREEKDNWVIEMTNT